MPTLKSYTFASHTSQPMSQSLQKSMPFQPHRHSDTADRHTTKDRRAAGNSGFAKWRVQCFYDSLVQGSTFGILMNICAENPPLRKAAKRYGQVY
jgi:hypothetical protein